MGNMFEKMKSTGDVLKLDNIKGSFNKSVRGMSLNFGSD